VPPSSARRLKYKLARYSSTVVATSCLTPRDYSHDLVRRQRCIFLGSRTRCGGLPQRLHPGVHSTSSVLPDTISGLRQLILTGNLWIGPEPPGNLVCEDVVQAPAALWSLVGTVFRANTTHPQLTFKVRPDELLSSVGWTQRLCLQRRCLPVSGRQLQRIILAERGKAEDCRWTEVLCYVE